MPQDGLFFRVLRRFNILWIALAGLALIAVGGYWLYTNVYLPRVHPLAEFIVPPDADAKPGTLTMALDNFASADTVYGPWNRQLFVLSRAPKSTDGIPVTVRGYVPSLPVNLMVLDNKSGEGTWLFPNNNQIISSRDALLEGPAPFQAVVGEDVRPVIGMVMLVRPVDKDGNAVASTEMAVYVWTNGQASARKLMTVEKLESCGQSGADRYLVAYRKGDQMRAAMYSVPDFSLISDKPLPAAPK